MKNKKIILAAIAVVVVIGLMAGVWFLTRQEAVKGDKTITVTVVHKDGSKQTFTCHTDEEFLGPVLVTEKIVEGVQGPYGLEIHSADGEKADWSVDKGWWQVFIGEESATLGADSIPIKDGDTFKLVYTLG